MTVKDESIAIENEKKFNETLKNLGSRQGGGIEYYQIRSDCIYEYNPIDSTIYHYIDFHGYREHSLGGLLPLTSEEIDDLYFRVRLGLVEIYIIQLRNNESERIYHTDSNFIVKKE